ncbi:MAG: PAS domain-containing protein [Pseudomonadota bacterium]
MTEFRAEVGYSAISQVEAYWEGLRGMRIMPKRSDIDPRGIESALEYTFVLERIAPGMARIRIAGSHLSDLMGMEVRGMPLTSLITPPCRRQISDALEEVFQRPAVCELRLVTEQGVGKPHMDARLILLPLKSDLGDVSRILGCLVAQGDIGLSPRRFDVVGAKIRPISAPALQAPTPEQPETADTPAPAPAPGMAEPPAPFEARPVKPGAPYLRLVKSDD